MRHLLVYIHILIFTLVLGIPSAVLGLPPAADEGWKWIWERGEKKWLPQFEITARPGNHGIHGMELDGPTVTSATRSTREVATAG
jgi:hypothetical protein